jgi:2-polyprenyl-3-methyl-5-hydroxy-6-metoxy-1,4-benzoquinol methylase
MKHQLKIIKSIRKYQIQILGERTGGDIDYLKPTFFQHQSVYRYASRFIKDKIVMDMGCGSGYGTNYLAHYARQIKGLDIDSKAIKQAKENFKRKNLSYEVLNLKSTKIKNKFDVVISFQVIEHITDVDSYLQFITNVLTKGGIAILSTPNILTQGYNENPFHIKEYNYEELKDILEKYFDEVDIKGLFGNYEFQKYEKQRKLNIKNVMKVDIFNLRKRLPKNIRIVLSSIFAFLVRKSIDDNVTKSIDINNFKINRYTKECVDLVAKCIV